MKTLKFFLLLGVLILEVSCADQAVKDDKRDLSNEFKAYWFEQGAEITAYDLTQVRYGEARQGKAVFVFVTEPFDPVKLVKPDEYHASQVQVLKLNALRKFVTGVYDYSMMTSTFFPLLNGTSSLKMTASSQEWCGHTFLQLENRKKMEITGHSYFESEGEQQLKLEPSLLEDDLFSMIRLDPQLLPKGKFKILPLATYMRLKHVELKSYDAQAEMSKANDSTSQYRITYPELKRTMEIRFRTQFPHEIFSWSESYPEDWTGTGNIMTTTATRSKSLRLRYWENHAVIDSVYREMLQLPR